MSGKSYECGLIFAVLPTGHRFNMIVTFHEKGLLLHSRQYSQIAMFMGPTWGPPGSCRPQMGPMLAPWTLLSGLALHDYQTACGLSVEWPSDRSNEGYTFILLHADLAKIHLKFHIFPDTAEHCTGNWNLSSWDTWTHFSYIVNIMAADNLTTRRARISIATVLASPRIFHIQQLLCQTKR